MGHSIQDFDTLKRQELPAKCQSPGVRNLESKSAQGQKPGQEASQRRRKRLRHNLARGFYDYSRAEGP